MTTTTTATNAASPNPYGELAKTLLEQERLLQVERFDDRDAWALGGTVVNHIFETGIDLGTSIFRPNGTVMFRYLSKGAGMGNIEWMRRKFNTIAATGHCSLYTWACWQRDGEGGEYADLAAHNDYAVCGGGFPLMTADGDLLAVLTVSALPHQKDHAFLTECLAAWKNVEIPRATIIG
ncbi:heme-binding protein [Bifidobacterium simiarum]|nr:heme-binding protein [Bifidobacterium simiarum]